VTRDRRRRELAALAWPEAAGIAPAQREALELSVRHGLAPAQIAAVLSLKTTAAEDLLLNAACEAERTRAALRVVESGGCHTVERLAEDERPLLGAALRCELVQHVDECPPCRRTAERAMAGVSWPGTAPTVTALTVVPAPRPAVEAAVELARRARIQHVPRFDRTGFPVHETARPARRDRLRGRALVSTVIAAVLATPVVALWAAYRGSPVTDESQADRSATAPDTADGAPDGRGSHPADPGSLDPYRQYDYRGTYRGPYDAERRAADAPRAGGTAGRTKGHTDGWTSGGWTADGRGNSERNDSGTTSHIRTPQPLAQGRGRGPAAPPWADRSSTPMRVTDPPAPAARPQPPEASDRPAVPSSPTGADTPTPRTPGPPGDAKAPKHARDDTNPTDDTNPRDGKAAKGARDAK
jgi:hypothetical protein